MIEMKNVSKFYGNFRALNNINLEIETGEVIGLLGPNGAGKTTAMRILTSFIPATEGTVSVAGFDVFEDSLEVRRRLGYLPETPPLYPEMTVKSYLDFIGDIKELSHKVKKKRISEVVSRIGLSENYDRIIGTLSKGFRQRVGLAQALLHDPEILILDEPTVGLDPNQIIEIRELIKDLTQDHTIILSTHILSEVRMTCKKVVIINEGEVVASDSVENLEKSSDNKSSWNMRIKFPQENWKKSFEDFEGATLSKEEKSDSSLSFNLTLSDPTKFDELFQKSVKSGVVYREIIPQRTTLEDVFLKLTANTREKEII